MCKCAEGFSLLEVLVALVIVAVVVTSALGLSIQLSHGSIRETENAIAQVLASSALQQAVAELPAATTEATVFAPPFERYRHTIQTTLVGASPLRRYTVRVEWSGGSLQQQQTVFDTTRFEP